METYGGWAKGMPRKLCVFEELAVPVNVAASNLIVGAAARAVRVAPAAARVWSKRAAKRTPKLSGDIPQNLGRRGRPGRVSISLT
jgi:hypothetical protein